MQWAVLILPALKKQRQEDCGKLEASLAYTVSLGQLGLHNGTLQKRGRRKGQKNVPEELILMAKK